MQGQLTGEDETDPGHDQHRRARAAALGGAKSELDTSAYPKGIKISDRQMKDLERRVLRRHQIHGEWKYSLIPARRP